MSNAALNSEAGRMLTGETAIQALARGRCVMKRSSPTGQVALLVGHLAWGWIGISQYLYACLKRKAMEV